MESYNPSSELVSGEELAKRSLTYIRIRWYVALALCVGTVTIFGNLERAAIVGILIKLLALLVLANLVFWLAVRAGRKLSFGYNYFSVLASAQLLFDLFYYSLVVVLAPDVERLQIFYAIPILVARALYSRRTGYLTAVLASCSYLVATFLQSVRLGESGDLSVAYMIRASFFAAMLIVFAAVADYIYALRREEEAARAQTEMVSLASHQLRTPATAVKGFLSIVLDGGLGTLKPKQKNFIKQAMDENEKQLRLIDNILGVARIELKSLHFHAVTTDIGELINEVIEDHMTKIRELRQTINFREPKAPIEAEVDPQLLRMVLDNLISNASKFTGRGGQITIYADVHNNQLRLSVEDNGIGMTRTDQQLLFKRFSRIPQEGEMASAGGSGLGLYIAKELVKMHGGRIDLTSYPNEGTMFTVTLPIKAMAN